MPEIARENERAPQPSEEEVERVARAIVESFERGSPDIAATLRMDWQTWAPEARAAIAARRPPVVDVVTPESCPAPDQGMMEALERLRDICRKNYTETNKPDRIKWEGVWYAGPAANAFLRFMKAVGDLCDQALSASPAESRPVDDEVVEVLREARTVAANRHAQGMDWWSLADRLAPRIDTLLARLSKEQSAAPAASKEKNNVDRTLAPERNVRSHPNAD